ncbi:MAG: carboxypeptidase-like regulatory domain-containing protein [Acidobacteriia bacterium]|nr:carboxypeptidase-like regulatory domain-containing protein [Terriglobia bacterium]
MLAQTPDVATVSGRVTDQSRAAVPDVHIVVKNAASGIERSA